MAANMIADCHHLQIIRRVIERVFVNVMDNLARLQFATKLGFHDQPVLVGPTFNIGNLNHPVGIFATFG
jgi:hypothetical protein